MPDASLKSYGGKNANSAQRSRLIGCRYIRIEPKSVIVTLNVNGSTISEDVMLSAVYSQTEENEITLIGEDPVRFGYDFTGWNTAAAYISATPSLSSS